MVWDDCECGQARQEDTALLSGPRHCEKLELNVGTEA